MLVLSRKVGQTIVIGDSIRVTVEELIGYGRGARVRLRFDAPREVQIDRSEVRLAKDAQRAAGSGGGQ